MAVAVSGPADKLRKAVKSSALVPANWNFAQNGSSAISMICEVVTALDRKRMGEAAQNADLRQHLYHHGAQRPHSRLSSSRLPEHRGSDSYTHSTQRGGRHSHTRSRSLELRQARSPRPDQACSRLCRGAHGGPCRSQYEQGGHAQEYYQSFGPPQAYPGPASVESPHERARGDSPHRSRGFTHPDGHASGVDNKHPAFSRDTLGRVPRHGSRIVAGGTPLATRCPQCRQNIMTVIKRHTGAKNVAATVAVAAAGVAINAPATLLPLALTVLDLGSLKRKVHHCPYCDYKLGRHITLNIPPK
ncbi:hypothetical protein IWQ57_006227 [Coemansia nantahalensis]|uniref:Uncharacterized protein n=1 Tax=Coemansia nantahalensis TaxID=2789366 RepID=A0ACC1JKP3_9FUNG|nr:hypothetical protein IWQ57_006227 [Coemansia nantahalensis]